jgi:parvulin-like peptidyl-prolyl isomerase
VQKSGVDALFGDAADYRKLEPFKSKVRQVLISWKGKSTRVTPKDPERTREQALALVEEIIGKARADSEVMELQRQYNEDTVQDNTYDVTDVSNFVKPFKRLAADLKVGEVGYCESQFGFHILKRIE